VSLSPKEIGDVAHKLGEVFPVYGKKFDASQSKLWINALAEKPVNLILRACDEYVKIGKYAPKPVDILGLIDQLKAGSAARESKPEQHRRGDPLIAQAWITYMRFAHDFELPAAASTPSMPIEQALEIVNREAAKHDRPDSIKPEHRIESYWGSAAA